MNIDTEKQFKRQNEFIKQNYDRHNLTMPKGKKARIKKAAAATGQSVNEFINTAIDAALLAIEDPALQTITPGNPDPVPDKESDSEARS